MNNIILLLITHFIGDFILQTDHMALNKSKSNYILFLHCLVYSLCFLYFGLPFAMITFGTHFATDYFTSRINSYFWINYKRHWFFVGIGADQLIHTITLILTYGFLYG